MRQYELMRGNWGLPPQPPFIKRHQRQYLAFSLLLYLTTFVYGLLSTQSYLAWAIMVVALSVMAFLDLTGYEPRKALISHTALVLAVLYIHVYVLFEQTSLLPPFFPPFQLKPHILLELLLGILFSGRLVVGLLLVDGMRTWQQGLSPTSPYARSVLATYHKLVGKAVVKPFPPRTRVSPQFSWVFVGSVGVVGLLLLTGLLLEWVRVLLHSPSSSVPNWLEVYPFIPLFLALAPWGLVWAWWLYQAAKDT